MRHDIDVRALPFALLVASLTACAPADGPGDPGAAETTQAATQASFSSGFESSDPAPTWKDTLDFSVNVSGYYASIKPEASIRHEETHGGAAALVYSGTDNSASTSYAYAKVYSVNIAVAASTTLSYWIRPDDANGAYAAVDLEFTDGTALRNLGAKDARGCSVHPAAGHCGAATAGTWTQVSSAIGQYANGRVIDKIWVAYDHGPGTGQYRGYIDDIVIEGGPPPTPTYYVSPSGNDANDGSSQRPWRSVQKAVNTAPSSSTIQVAAGSYSPFVVTRSGLTIAGPTGATAVVKGAAGVQDVVRIAANNVKVSNLTVTGCVPNASPPGSFEDQGSSGVRIHDGTQGVVVDSVVINESYGTTGEGLPFGCYAVMIHDATDATVSNSNIYHNGYGIFVSGGGAGVVLKGNTIHDNNAIIRNTIKAGDDYGAIGIGFDKTAATPGPVASGNTFYNNVGPSHDYVTDGGGFEIYQASNVTMTGNTIYNNENILETGTGSGGDCVNNRFTNNTASGKTSGSTLSRSLGLILRCAHSMIIDSNHIGPVDWWVFDIAAGGHFGGNIDGLTITNNTIDQLPAGQSISQKTYALEVNPSPFGMNIDKNHFHYQKVFGSDWNNTVLTTLGAWQTETGFDRNSTTY